MKENTKLELSMEDLMGNMKAFGKDCMPERPMEVGAVSLCGVAAGVGAAAAGVGTVAMVGAVALGVGAGCLVLGTVKTIERKRVVKDLIKKAE